MKALISITLGLLMLGSSFGNAAKVYKWVDDEGVVHYGDNRPEGKDSITMRVQSRGPGKQHTQSADTNNTDADEGRDTTSNSTRKNTMSDKERKAIQESCKNAKTQVRQLTDYSRVRIKENGELRFLSEEEKKNMLKTARQYITDYCK